MDYQGLKISIEQAAGSIRRGTNADGTEWATFMRYPYGYIRMTEGVDGDHVDCYVGANPHAPTVFIVNQLNPATGQFDEQKVMLGFDTLEDARAAYLQHYDTTDFLGNIQAMPIQEFRDKVIGRHNWGTVVKAAISPTPPAEDPPKELAEARQLLADLHAAGTYNDRDSARIQQHLERTRHAHATAANGLGKAIRDLRDSALHHAYVEHNWETQRATALHSTKGAAQDTRQQP